MSERDAHETIGSTKLLVVVLLTLQMAYNGVNLMPFLMGGLIDHRGFDSAAAGVLGSAEMAGMALAAVGLAALVSRGRRRWWVLAGIGVATLGHGISSLDLGYEMLIASRGTAGFGEGMLLAGGMAAAAGASDPTRLFAQVSVAQAILFALQIVAAPFVLAAFGIAGIFVALAIITLMIAPLAAWIPDAPISTKPAAGAAAPSSNRNIAVLAIISLVIMAISQFTIWVLSERLGGLAGLSAESIGVVLGLNNLAGIAGAAAAVWLGTRHGSVRPVAVGLTAFVVCAVAMIEVNQPAVFTGSNILFGLAFYFFFPYIMGALASLDRAGRWTATAAGMQTIGIAIGPVLGGVLVTMGWGAVSLLMIVSTPIGFALLLPALRFAGRGGDDDDVHNDVDVDAEPVRVDDASSVSSAAGS